MPLGKALVVVCLKTDVMVELKLSLEDACCPATIGCWPLYAAVKGSLGLLQELKTIKLCWPETLWPNDQRELTNLMETPLMQNRSPVGRGPSSNTCPKWALHCKKWPISWWDTQFTLCSSEGQTVKLTFAQVTSTRVMPWVWSGVLLMFCSASAAAKNAEKWQINL